MKQPIQHYIFELLQHHDCVIITGLGGFILNPRQAHINPINYQIHPPSKIISFNKHLSQNDGLLANYLTQVENIGYDEACLQILKFTRKVKLKLESGESVLFNNIGEIHYNQSKQIEFKSDTSFNFKKDSYGFNHFQLYKIHNENTINMRGLVSAAAIIIILISLSIFSLSSDSFDNMVMFNLHPSKTTPNYSPRELIINTDSLGKETPGIYNVQVSQIDFDLYKINGTNYHIATKKCFKLGFARDVQLKIWKSKKNRIERQLCFLNVSETEYDDCYKVINVYNEITSDSKKVMVLTKKGRMKEAVLVLEESYIDPYIIANSNPETKTDNTLTNLEDSVSDKNIGERFISAIQSVTEKTPPPPKLGNVATKKIAINNNLENNKKTKNVFIIVGSFSSVQNAKALSKQLKRRGFLNADIVGTNETGLIRVCADSFYTEEEAHLVLANIKNSLSSAWVLNAN